MVQPKTFRPKPRPSIEAMQIKLTNFEDVVAWIESDGAQFAEILKVDADALTIVFKTPYGPVQAGYNWWVAKDGNGRFYPLSPKNMQTRYEEVVNA